MSFFARYGHIGWEIYLWHTLVYLSEGFCILSYVPMPPNGGVGREYIQCAHSLTFPFLSSLSIMIGDVGGIDALRFNPPNSL